MTAGAEEPAKPPAATSAPGPSPEIQGDFTDKLREIASELFAIEINTIVKSNMTATKMPGAAHALLDVASEYDGALNKLGAPARALGAPSLDAPRVVNLAELDDLRTRACKRHCELEARGPRPDGFLPLPAGEDADAAVWVLHRISDNCDQLKGILLALEARLGEPQVFTRTTAVHVKLLPNESLLLRKIWEIGIEEVLIQTVIHIDGDVVTRIRPDVTTSYPGLLAIHQAAVTTSTGFWRTLVGTLAALVEAIGRIAFTRA